MRKTKDTTSAAARAGSKRATRIKQPDNSPKMTNLNALLAEGQPAPSGPVFPKELKSHGDILEKGIHAVGAPLSRWRLIKGSVEISGIVYQADNGGVAGDGDTNFELVIPRLDPATGQLSDEAKAINAKIDAFNESLGPQGNHAPHIEAAEPNRLRDGRIGIHCEVDASDLAALKEDLAGMMIEACYVVSGQLVLDTWHGGLYELHPVQTIDRCAT